MGRSPFSVRSDIIRPHTTTHRGENKANKQNKGELGTVQSDGSLWERWQRATALHLPRRAHSFQVIFVLYHQKQPPAPNTLLLTCCKLETGSTFTYIISTPPGVTEDDVCSLLDEESVVHSGSETESLLQGSLFGEVFL